MMETLGRFGGRSWSCLWLFSFYVPTLAASLARQTSRVEDTLSPDGWTPRPTNAPPARAQLFKRDDQYTTCGYFDGDPNRPLTCAGGAYCTWDASISAADCCSNDETCTTWFQDCYDYKDTSDCTGACTENTSVGFCDEATAPYCFTLSYVDLGYTSMGCTSVSGLTVSVSYNSKLPSPTPASIAKSSTSSSSTTTSASPTQGSDTPSSSGGSGLSKGSIAGIAVGVSCAVVGLVFGIGFTIWKRRKSQNQKKRADIREIQPMVRG